MRDLAKRGLKLAALVLALTSGSFASAAPTANGNTPQYGSTLPPIGFVRFCGENPTECLSTGKAGEPVAMTPEQWNLVYQVNTFVNGKIKPVSDLELYGEAEYWTYPTTAGDCEDYLLLKKRYLEGLGFPSSSLLITVVLDEKREGHAVLTLATAEGDFILDNRRNEILGWEKTRYTYLKRQKAGNPKLWVALSKKKSGSPDRMASK